MIERYTPKTIEPKWQEKWEENGTFRQYDRREKFYVLDMFPYPSGAGLHVGHPRGYIATDVVARMKQLQGYGVLHPMGWDAFGLPAEQFAIKNRLHPSASVQKNVETFKGQLGKIGFTYDWEREINTTDPNYYKWTQWIFLQIWKKGLAYESNEPINWCPSCQTGLANEDLENGACERCGTQVEKKPLRQWVLAMTKYADRLLYDLDSKDLEWGESIKEQQRNWIGRSEGVIARFALKIQDTRYKIQDTDSIEVFTTRVDTIFGCTYVVVAPEHELLTNHESRITNHEEIQKYREATKKKSDLERTELSKEKTGVKLEGVEAVNPFTGESVPVYVADYVLGSYGTGAVMAVPAHDERDFEFANKHNISMRQVVVPKNRFRAIAVAMTLDDSETFKEELRENGVDFHLAISKISNREHIRIEIEEDKLPMVIQVVQKHIQGTNWVEMLGSRSIIVKKSEVHLDFLNEPDKWFERFQKWEPLLKGQKNIWDLLGKNDFFRSLICYTEDGILTRSGEWSDLDSAMAREKMTAWLEEKGFGKKTVKYKMRDWTFSRQRYWGEPIPLLHCEQCGVVPVPENALPVKLPDVESYEPTGTGESPLADISEWVNVTCPECGGPAKRETNTMPQWAGSCWYYLRFIDPKNDAALVDPGQEKKWMPVDLYVGGTEHATRHLLYARFWHKFLFDIGVVSTAEPFTRLVNQGLILASDGRKMSKRWGNVVNPDDMVADYGADAFRLYEMFMGPFGQSIAWNTDGVVGTRRFLDKVWRLAQRTANSEQRTEESEKIETVMHKTIKKVTEDIEAMRFNTAVSALMILANVMEKESAVPGSVFKPLLILLSPFAPHIAEELWEKLGNEQSIFLEKWPEYDPEKVVEEEITVVIQVNGRVRDTIVVPADIAEDDLEAAALGSEKVGKYTEGKEPKKIIVVPGRLVNIIV